MGYYSQVVAAIGGQPEKVEQFIHKLASKFIENSCDILKEFKIIKLQSNLSVFIFYDDQIKWYFEETTWQTMCELAEQSQLSFIFYRIGEELGDIEIQTNDHKDYFDSRLSELFSFSRDIEMHDERLYEVLK